MNIDISFKEFCRNGKKRGGMEAGEGYGVNGGLYLVDTAAYREEDIIDVRGENSWSGLLKQVGDEFKGTSGASKGRSQD